MKTQKQRIFSILAILTMAVILTCIFAACDKTSAQEKTFTITFDSMGGSNVPSITIKGGETFVMPANPTKSGYIFAGWYLDASYVELFEGGISINGNLTLYAKWKIPEAVEGTQAIFKDFSEISAVEYSTKVANTTTFIDLSDYVTVNSESSWALSTDIYGNQTIASKTATLNLGDNIYYIVVTAKSGATQLYTLRIRRRPVFIVSFDTVGGTSIDDQIIEEDSSVQAPVTTKEGYRFDGWYYDENYSTAYKATDTFTSNTTLYAKWNENKKQFTNIVFNDQTFSYDGTPHSLSISGYPEGTDVSFDIPNSQTLVGVYKITATLSKVGYETKTYSATMTIDKGIIDTSKFVFEDKEFQQDGTPKSLELIGDLPYGVTVEYINNNQTLDGVYTVTAHFIYDRNLYYEVSDMTAKMTIVTPLVSYNIHYELNKGVNSGKNPSTYLSPNENEIKLYPATRSAWIFDGWYRNENFEGSAITELPKNTSGDIYLYAKWVKPYIIAADDLFTINDKTITATVGHDVSIYSFIESFNACSDCTWSLYSDYLGTNELVLKNMQLNYGMNTAYIVVWSEDRSAFTQYTLNVYRLSMRNYSYSILGCTVDAGQIEEQSALNAPDDPDVQHYIFEGWYVGDQQISFPYTVHVDTVITAKMTPIEYDLTYVLNGGTNDDSNPTTYNVENISTLMSRLQKATKDYYDFIQWSLSLEDIAKIESGELGSLTLNADFTPTVYNLIFHKDGGNYASEYKKWKSLFIDVDMAQWENCYEEWLTEKGLSAVLDKMKECNLTFSDIELAWQLVESGKKIDEVVWQPLSEEEARNAWASRVLSVVYSEFNATTPCEPEIFVLYYEFFGLCESSDAYETTYTVESNDILFESIHKNGYKFVGWYDNAEFNGEPITLISAGSHGNVELYAKWEQVTFNFVYDLDGGVNDAANPLTFTIDTFISAITNLRSSSKDYYNFKSWTCGPEDSAVEAWEADGNASLCTYSDNYCLIAQYTPIDYSITFNLSGGNLAETPVSKYNIETADITLPIPSRTGYTFVGWFDNDQLSGEAIDCIPLGSHDDKVFYAKWQTIDYAITYDLNDANSVSPATNSTSNPATYTIEDAVVFEDPTRAGYKFTGWSISNINVGTYGEKTITANWQIINYDITYDLNDSNSVSFATNNGTNSSTYTIEENVTFAAPTRAGYEFTGWTLPSIAQGLTGAVSTTATWEIINYSITYDFAIAESSKSQVVDNSANTVFSYTIEDEVSFNAPTRAGYTFASWDVPTIAKGTYGNKTIVASWNIVDYSITYNLNGGTNHSENPLSFNVEQLPITLKDADSEDDVFNSWRSTNSIDGDKITQITTIGDKTVYALFGGTEGLQYSLSSDGTYYSVSGYTGTLTDVVIGKRYNNKPVTAISREAFKNNTNIVSIKLSNTITSIGEDAFNVALEYISVSENNSVYSSDGGILYDKDKTKTIYVPKSIQGAISIPDGVLSIGNYAFRNCSGLTSITIPNSVTSIGSSAFSGCTSLESITIPFVGAKAGVTSSDTYQYPFGYIFGTSSYTGGVATKQYYLGSSTSSTTYSTYYIPSSLKSVIVTGGNILYGTFYDCSGLTSISIPDNITSIGVVAFRNCSSLTSITIPNSVTSIGNYAFENCSGLTSVTIGNGVTSIGNYAFSGCSGFTSITIPDSITSIPSYAFSGCSGLTSISIPDSVTSIGNYVFDGCTGLTSVTIPDSITSIPPYAFSGCSSLTSITIPDSVTSIGDSAFYGCSSLTSITIPDSVTSISDSAFRYCTGLTSVTIPDSVTSIGRSAFSGCTSLTTVNWNAASCEILASKDYPIFNGCTNLFMVNIGRNVTIIPSDIFAGCREPKGINYAGDVARWCEISGLINLMSSPRTLYIGGKKVEGELVIPDNVTSIGDYAFRGCTTLTSITIPDSVMSIASSAFRECTGLTSVTIGNGVTSIGYSAFEGCTGLISVTIGNSVTSIGDYAFAGCSSLTSMTIPRCIGSSFGEIFGRWSYPGSICVGGYYIPSSLKFVTVTGGKISKEYFANCSSIISVTIGNGVTSIENSAFYGCTGLTTVNWNATECTNEASWSSPIFGNCSKLATVVIGDDVTTIPSDVFSGCKKLTNIYYTGDVVGWCKTSGFNDLHSRSSSCNLFIDGRKVEGDFIIPDSVTSICDYAFKNCNDLTSVTIPDSVTSIGYSAFYGCRGLTSVTIGNSVTSIGNCAFEYCYKLVEVHNKSTLSITAGSSSNGYVAYYAKDVYTVEVGSKLWTDENGYVIYIDGTEKILVAYHGTNTELILPSCITKINRYAFYGCTGLTSITIPDSVTSIGYCAFYDCTGLTSIYYIGDIAGWCSINGLDNLMSNSRTLYIGGKKVEGDFIIPDSVTSIGSYAFAYCSRLTSVTIGNGVTSIGDDAFYNCCGLTSIIVDEGNTKYHSAGNCLIETATKTLILGCNTSVIPADGSVTSIGDDAFYNCCGLTSIVIPDSVTSIDRYAFSGCSGLTSVTIGNSVTSIDRYAFSGCSGLTSVTIGNSVTSIGVDAFFGCTGLTSIYYTGDIVGWCSIKGLDNLMSSSRTLYIGGKKVEGDFIIPDSVTSIGNSAFRNCSGLTSITIPDSVTSIGYYAFRGCSGLTSVTIGNGVTSIGDYAFFGCTTLTSITIPDSVTSIGASAFCNCSGLTSVTIPNSVTSIGDSAFYNCYNLIEVYNKSTLSITLGSLSNGYVAYYAKNVYTVEAGSKLWIDENGYVIYIDGTEKILVAYIGAETNLTLPSGITQIKSYAFYRCTGLTSITIPDSVTSIGSYAFAYCSRLTSVTIGNGVTSIGNSAFVCCSSLTSVTIGNGVTSIGGNAFYKCYKLVEVYNKSTLSITLGSSSNGYVAYYAQDVYTNEGGSKLTTDENGYVIYTDGDEKILVAYHGTNTELVLPSYITKINRYAFYECTGLTSITIPDSVTSIGEYAFQFCSKLETVNWNATACTNAGMYGNQIFEYCPNLTTITIGNNVTTIPSSAFRNCSGLISITIPDSVTSIGSSAFYGCTSLTSIVIPDSVTSIDRYVFYDCSGLTSITIPDSVTSIGSSAFDGCSGLTSITIPDSVTSIGSSAFDGCSGLTSVTIPNSVTSIGEYAFKDCGKLETVNWNATGCASAGSKNYPIFDRCFNLSTVNIGSNVTTIPSYAFFNCSKLKSATIPDGVTSIGRSAFGGCTGLTIVNWNATECTSVGTEDDLIFDGCFNLATVNIGQNVTIIPSNTFRNCRGIKSITIPNNVTSIGEAAFSGCSGLASITIPDSIVYIGDFVFEGCTTLTSVSIHGGVTRIGNGVFWNCVALTDIIFNGTKAQWDTIAKGNFWDYNAGNYTLYCTDGKISKNNS